ncbi:unnamed protein product [Effrenium voratum]|uniref:Uncharacterized protein n=1 Tax=Effrenium voratum TaxID=2562239 RepID=A0AA36IY63_9DINO|nr:unnamed protein product [Effrenium voratum]CAJ1395041.1 unnamed protein product [Effrenium voratum]CAJ1444721.1 unnamed protein product [Effrenium voratum]
MGQQPSKGLGNEVSEKTVKAFELLNLYKELEESLALGELRPVAEAYRQILSWCRARRDRDLQSVLELLGTEERCPAWRRQALEDAFRLFYDEAAALGVEGLAQLKEPPTSEEIGFRQLPEALVDAQAWKRKSYSGFFEESGNLVYRRRWEYEILRVDGGQICGRKIVTAAQSSYICSTALAVKAIQTLVPVDECCAVREDARAMRGPFLLPKGPRGAMRWEPADEGQESVSDFAAPKVCEPLHFEDGCVAPARARLAFPKPRGI